MLDRPISPRRSAHRIPVAADARLANVLARAFRDASLATPGVLDAVAAHAGRLRAAGHSSAQVVVTIRRSLAAAVPAAMTAATFEVVARALVRHALQSLSASGPEHRAAVGRPSPVAAPP